MSTPVHLLCDEVHQVTSDGVTGLVSVRVTADIPPPVLRPDLGKALADVVRDQCYPSPEPRTATFAGFLGFEDYSVDHEAGIVTIKRPARNAAAAKLTELLAGAVPSEQVIAAAMRAAPSLPPVSRSARPFTVKSQNWLAEFAGLGAEDTGRMFAKDVAPAAADGAGLPGEALEVWLLPVTSIRFDYLITPAGEWPPDGDS